MFTEGIYEPRAYHPHQARFQALPKERCWHSTRQVDIQFLLTSVRLVFSPVPYEQISQEFSTTNKIV